MNYNLYVDDGADGAFAGPYAVAPTISTWDTSALPLITGLIYKFKYSATNIHGEGPLSDEVSILMAEKPSSPTSFERIEKPSMPAGQIKVVWALPADQGGDPVLGYKIYLDDVLHYDARFESSLNSFTYSNLSIGQTYTLGVSAVNDIGEGPKATMVELAASVPMKLNVLTFVSST